MAREAVCGWVEVDVERVVFLKRTSDLSEEIGRMGWDGSGLT
jgi:hypothetical protein